MTSPIYNNQFLKKFQINFTQNREIKKYIEVLQSDPRQFVFIQNKFSTFYILKLYFDWLIQSTLKLEIWKNKS